MTQKNKLDDQAHALIVQKHQLDSAIAQFGQMNSALDIMSIEQRSNQELLETLLDQVGATVKETDFVFEIEEEDTLLIEESIYVSSNEVQPTHQILSTLDYIAISSETDWDDHLSKVDAYATQHDIDFGNDPFRDLMSTSQRIALEKRIKEEFSLQSANCDKYDYMIAGTCGLIGVLIDILFVSTPKKSQLGNFTDQQTNKIVIKFADLMGSNIDYDKYTKKKISKGELPIDRDLYFLKQSIQFLEGKFSINYDQTRTSGHNGTSGLISNLYPKNHHIKSLGHSPDIIGLFFSILNQFTNTSSFIDQGKIITINNNKDSHELQGTDFLSKVIYGFINWFGHIASDIAGSNSSAGKGKRGSGVPIPFYSLLQFIDIGEFGKDRQSFAKIAVQVFEEGYDFRHGMALAIPVLVTEILTRITWVIKQRFYHKKSWDDCIPSANNPELRRMLLIGHGSLCLVDTTDAALRSGGDIIQFMLRSNLLAWARFGTLALKELNAWYRKGDIDEDAVDTYLDAEYTRLLQL